MVKENILTYKSAFTDLITRDGPLAITLKTTDIGVTLEQVFLTETAIDPFAPALKTWFLKVGAHEFDYSLLGQVELVIYGLKWGAVFPGHFDDAV